MIDENETRTRELLSGHKFISYKVENRRGESLGKVEDLAISAEEGRVAYVVVSFGGVLKLGHKLFAFPWDAFRVDHPGKRVFLDLDRATLARAHGFDRSHWPDTGTWDLDAEVAPPLPSTVGAPSAPPIHRSPATDSGPSDGKRMDHWGESWQSHGLERR